MSKRAVDVGAEAYRTGGDNRDWRPMSEAPRDGTWIEIKNFYGVAPSYGLHRWSKEGLAMDGDADGGLSPIIEDSFAWRQYRDAGYYTREDHLLWRPYKGEPADYVDPTGGLQNDMAYWRGAAAAKYGLAPDTFEEIAERNRRAAIAIINQQADAYAAITKKPVKSSWYRRLVEFFCGR